MKKILRKVFPGKSAPPPETGGRITNETVAEHRERILAGGRKFKYPLQYTKHRVLLMSIGIVVIASISFLGFAAWQLYGLQGTDKFIYRLTQAIPVPVASVDGELVRYSDYLRELRSTIHYFSTKEAVNFSSDDGKRQLEYQKRLALDKAVENAIIAKIANKEGIEVGNKEVNDFVDQQINSNRLGLNEDAYRQVIQDYYDWSLEEYKESIKKQLLRKKVSAQLDKAGRDKAIHVVNSLTEGADFAGLAGQFSDDATTKGNGGDAGFVAADANDPNGLVATADALEVGKTSDLIEGVDGFYVIKLLEEREGELRIARIFIAYTYLNQTIIELKDQGKLQEFITVEPVASPTT